MDAAAEADVCHIAATDVEPIRVVESSRVALRSAEQHRDFLADLHRLASDLHAFLQHPPLEQVQRRVPAQHLLDRRASGDLTRHHPIPLPRVPKDRAQSVAERVDRRLMTGFDQHHRRGDDLAFGERVALVLYPHQLGHQQAVWIATLLGDQRSRVVDVLRGGRVGSCADLIGGAQLVHLHNGVAPVEQQLGVCSRNTKHRADDRDGVRLGVVAQ